MADFVSKPQFLRRPSNGEAIAEMVASLIGATTPPTEKDLHFPLTEAGTQKLVTALNEVDTSGQPALTAKELRDPWSEATRQRLATVDI